jgi:hypothetical protein
VSTFKEFHASQDPAEDDKVMHSVLEADNGITFMAADTPNSMEYKPGTNFNMSLSGGNEPELRVTSKSSPRAARLRCHSTTLPGVTCSAWSPTSSVSPG